jgi:hypothetical protein
MTMKLIHGFRNTISTELQITLFYGHQMLCYVK